MSLGSYVNNFLSSLPEVSLTSRLWNGFGWLNYFLYWVLCWSVWTLPSVAQLVLSHKVLFITYPEQLFLSACLGPLMLVLSWICSWIAIVFSPPNSVPGTLVLKTWLGWLFGFMKDDLKVVSDGTYGVWLFGWVNGNVSVPYLLEVAFKVSSVFGIWTALNLKV